MLELPLIVFLVVVAPIWIVAHYVTRWRMHVALDLLQRGEHSVAETAARVGYDSEAAFSRAFKRAMGVTPRDARAPRHETGRGTLVGSAPRP